MKSIISVIIFAVLVADAAIGEPTQEPIRTDRGADHGQEEKQLKDSLLEEQRQHPYNELGLPQPQVVEPPPPKVLLDQYIMDQINQLDLDENIINQLKQDPEYRELIIENAIRNLDLDNNLLYKLKHDPKYREQIEAADRKWYQSMIRLTSVLLFLVILLLGIIFLARRSNQDDP